VRTPLRRSRRPRARDRPARRSRPRSEDVPMPATRVWSSRASPRVRRGGRRAGAAKIASRVELGGEDVGAEGASWGSRRRRSVGSGAESGRRTGPLHSLPPPAPPRPSAAACARAPRAGTRARSRSSPCGCGRARSPSAGPGSCRGDSRVEAAAVEALDLGGAARAGWGRRPRTAHPVRRQSRRRAVAGSCRPLHRTHDDPCANSKLSLRP